MPAATAPSRGLAIAITAALTCLLTAGAAPGARAGDTTGAVVWFDAHSYVHLQEAAPGCHNLKPAAAGRTPLRNATDTTVVIYTQPDCREPHLRVLPPGHSLDLDQPTGSVFITNLSTAGPVLSTHRGAARAGTGSTRDTPGTATAAATGTALLTAAALLAITLLTTAGVRQRHTRTGKG